MAYIITTTTAAETTTAKATTIAWEKHRKPHSSNPKQTSMFSTEMLKRFLLNAMLVIRGLENHRQRVTQLLEHLMNP